MKTLEDVTIYSENVYSPQFGNNIIFWSNKMLEMFPWRPSFVMDMYYKSSQYIELSKNFLNINSIEKIDDLYMIYEFDESVYGHGLVNFCRKIEKFPKNTPIVVTNFSNYILELYDYLRSNEYNIVNFESVNELLVNKKLHIKRFHFDESPSLVSIGDPYDYFNIRNMIKKPGIVFLRKDAVTGINRKLLNSNDLKDLFLKYGFVVIEKFSSLSLYEKKIYMNNFDNIFIEGGCGLANIFLINDFKNTNVFNMQPPSYDSSYVYYSVLNAKVTNLNFGTLAIDSPLYGNKHDVCNEPWRIDLDKMEDILKKI